MSYLLLVIVVVMYIAIWPFNRWAMNNGGRTQTIGLVITTTGTILAAVGVLISGQPFFNGVTLLLGAITGLGYAIGFCMIIFYCLVIGPSGPTVTLNNLGFLFPVLIGIFFFSDGKALTLLAVAGVVLTIAALVLMAFNKTGDETKKHSAKWFRWVLLGWLLAGLAMGAQFTATQFNPDKPFTFAFCANITALFVLVIISVVKKTTKPKKEELIAGAATGFVNIASTVIIFYLVKLIPVFVIYPVIMATPILAMLVVGHYVYKEKMNRFGWAACIIGMIGLVLFNI